MSDTTAPVDTDTDTDTAAPHVRDGAETLTTPALPNGYRVEVRPEGGTPEAPLFYVLVDKRNDERQEQFHGQTEDDANALIQRYKSADALPAEARVQ